MHAYHVVSQKLFSFLTRPHGSWVHNVRVTDAPNTLQSQPTPAMHRGFTPIAASWQRLRAPTSPESPALRRVNMVFGCNTTSHQGPRVSLRRALNPRLDTAYPSLRRMHTALPHPRTVYAISVRRSALYRTQSFSGKTIDKV